MARILSSILALCLFSSLSCSSGTCHSGNCTEAVIIFNQTEQIQKLSTEFVASRSSDKFRLKLIFQDFNNLSADSTIFSPLPLELRSALDSLSVKIVEISSEELVFETDIDISEKRRNNSWISKPLQLFLGSSIQLKRNQKYNLKLEVPKQSGIDTGKIKLELELRPTVYL